MSEDKKRVGAGFGTILRRGNKILLGLRHEDPNKAGSVFRSAGVWTIPGGKLDWGESFEDGAIREIAEETGIVAKNPKVISVHNNMNEHAHYVTLGLFCEDFSGEAKVMEPDEITDWKWFDLDSLPPNIFFPTAEVIENYKKGEFYIKR